MGFDAIWGENVSDQNPKTFQFASASFTN